MDPRATWGGFVTWAIDGDIITKEALWAMKPRARTDFADAHWPEYVESLEPMANLKHHFFLEADWGHFMDRMGRA